MSDALEKRLAVIPSHEAAKEPKRINIPIPIALAFGIFDTVIGACTAGASALDKLQNPEAAQVLLSMSEDLQARAKAMMLESQRRIQLATELPR